MTPRKILFIGNSFTARNDVPGTVAEVLRRMMALTPEDRFRTPFEAATDLAMAAGDPELLAPPGGSPIG